MLPRAIQKLDQAAGDTSGDIVRLVLPIEDHFSLKNNIGQQAASGTILNVSLEDGFTVVELG